MKPRLHWRSVWITLAALAVAGGLGAAAVVGFGLYNVSARKGHLPGVGWLLHTTFNNSVDLWSNGTSPPPEPLDDPDMVALGAGHYDSACKMCHAAPGARRTATVLQMNPQPPHIEKAVQGWTPEQLHWIVHEGAKMTGMPGWPSPRSDDVWPVVAFLRAVQDGMRPEDYAALTRPPEDGYCAMCHGSDGRSGNPHVPRLDILSETYMTLALAAYRSGVRESGIMQQAATAVPEAVLPALASRFAAVPPAGAAQPLDDLARRGAALSEAGRGDDDVPACRACHGPWPEPLDEKFPSIAGQHAPYLRAQLRLWRDGQRGGGAAAGLMHQAAQALDDDDIAALAAYYSALAPATLQDVQGAADK